MLKLWMLGCVLFALGLAGCGPSRDIDMVAARKLSDAFMADWIAHRSDSAFDKMEPAFTGNGGINRSDFSPLLEKLSNYCGWPLDIELKDIQSGFKIYTNGHKNPTRKFIYAANTTQFSKGQCYFAVDIVPSQGTIKVTTFGPLRVTSGNPYP
jgi:hypothetical protein